jgi:hypothetical protein
MVIKNITQCPQDLWDRIGDSFIIKIRVRATYEGLQEFVDMDILLATSAKFICCFLAWLEVLFRQGSRYFILLIFGVK